MIKIPFLKYHTHNLVGYPQVDFALSKVVVDHNNPFYVVNFL